MNTFIFDFDAACVIVTTYDNDSTMLDVSITVLHVNGKTVYIDDFYYDGTRSLASFAKNLAIKHLRMTYDSIKAAKIVAKNLSPVHPKVANCFCCGDKTYNNSDTNFVDNKGYLCYRC